MKHYIEHIQRESLVSRMRITRLNSVSATLLIRLYKIFTKPYMDYACRALAALNKSHRQKLDVIQNRCMHYVRRVDDCTCISNNEFRSRWNIAGVEQHILALADRWWKKVFKSNDDIINFTYHHQSDSKTKTPLNIIKSRKFF